MPARMDAMATIRPQLDAEEPEHHAAEAMRRLLRGGNWRALAHEIAWNAAQRVGAGHEVLEWLPDLVEARQIHGPERDEHAQGAPGEHQPDRTARRA